MKQPELILYRLPCELYIEREDFMENAPTSKYFRLTPGERSPSEKCICCALYLLLEGWQTGNIEEIYCEYIPETKSRARKFPTER